METHVARKGEVGFVRQVQAQARSESEGAIQEMIAHSRGAHGCFARCFENQRKGLFGENIEAGSPQEVFCLFAEIAQKTGVSVKGQVLPKVKRKMDVDVGGRIVRGEGIGFSIRLDIPAVPGAESLFGRTCRGKKFTAKTQVKPFVHGNGTFRGQMQVAETETVQIRVVDVTFVMERYRYA